MEDFLDRMKARKQAPKLPDNNFPSEKFNKEISPKNVFVLPRGEEKNRAFEAAEKQIVQNRLRLADGIGQMVGAIQENPDIQMNAFDSKLALLSGLTGDQLDLLRQGIKMYTEKHEEVRLVAHEHPTDEALFTYIAGAAPKGKVQIIQGPMTLYVRCFDPQDYDRFINYNRIVGPEEKTSEYSSGYVLPMAKVPGLSGTLVAENSSRVDEELSRTIQDHEEQHVIMGHFVAVYDQYLSALAGQGRISPEFKNRERVKFGQDLRSETPVDFYTVFQAKTQGAREQALVRSLRKTMAYGEVKAKDEILAYTRNGYSPKQIIEILQSARDNPYDYFDSKWQTRLAENVTRQTRELGFDQNFIANNVRNIFNDEYRREVNQAVEGVASLQNAGLPQEQLIPLLMTEPFRSWPRLAKRVTKTMSEVNK